ncbi:unnamed protein product [Rotaria magnacalcarata]|uniref:EF-hand domain-containing protein n=1 Tax=Rotaria magnacalcarata TaxID=392030 RepID=A0A819RSG0_9BILA|nr:unnamed protein product [Rotaria magnacalcarata]CAF4660357.1 unnamed protein product [Rotaria magnacalcarata]
MVQQQLNELLNEPISEQYQRHFRKYFGGNITTKTFTIHEFAHLFQVTSLLTRLLWISPMSVKAFILFKLFDVNDDGNISIEEIRLFYEHYLSELRFSNEQNRLNGVGDVFLHRLFPRNGEQNQQEELNFIDFFNKIHPF